MSLRRPERPKGLPAINACTPWSEEDLADLKDMVREGHPPSEIAEHLRRELLEVEAKIADLLMTEPPVPRRRFLPPWQVKDSTDSYKIVDAHGQTLAYVHYGHDAGLTQNEARRIASNIARLPELLGASKGS